MTNNRRGTFKDAVASVFMPAPPTPSDTLRVADLFCGTGELGLAAKNAGLSVVYAEEPDADARQIYAASIGVTPQGIAANIVFDQIPSFDILMASLPDAETERVKAFSRALRFLRIRRPDAFVLMGDAQHAGDKFLKLVQDKTQRMGYTATRVAIVPGMSLSEEENLTFVVGTLGARPFVWPPVARSRLEDGGDKSAPSGGPDGRPSRTFIPRAGARLVPTPAFGGGELSAVRAVIQSVAAHVRGD